MSSYQAPPPSQYYENFGQPQPQPQYTTSRQPSYDYAPHESTSNNRGRGRRRSKNDNEGRIHHCNLCERTYLSYAALYTHKKTKHNPEYVAQQRRARRPEVSRSPQAPRLDPTTSDYFKSADKAGGPTAVIFGFEGAFNVLLRASKKYPGYEFHPLYGCLHKLHTQNLKTINYEREHQNCTADLGKPPAPLEGGGNNDGVLRGLILKNDLLGAPLARASPSGDERSPQRVSQRAKCADEIFAEYLNAVACKVNRQWYRTMLLFVLCFRECYDAFGSRQRGGGDDFCRRNGTDQAPETSNEFVTVYLEENRVGIGRQEAIELVQNMCCWLYVNGYTASKLSLAPKAAAGCY